MRLHSTTYRRAGFTLLEMVVVMWGLGVGMLLGVAVIVAANKAGGVVATADARVTSRAELARDFRHDVARAEAAPEKLGDAAAGPDRLILQMPGGSSVIYEWKADELTRTERTGDKETRRPLPLGPGQLKVEFPRPKDGLATLRLTETPKTGAARVADVSAALGGDLR